MISGKTTLIAHLGYPTESFKAPMIYNPWFEKAGIDAVVLPMGVTASGYPQVLESLFRLTNIRGALITMPHKVTTVALLDEATPTVQIAGSCNAILRRPDGSLLGDMFDGAGSHAETTANLLGPFWRPGSPHMANGESIVRSPTPGDPVLVRAWVKDRRGRPVADAEVDVWHASTEGYYESQDPAQADMNLRG